MLNTNLISLAFGSDDFALLMLFALLLFILWIIAMASAIASEENSAYIIITIIIFIIFVILNLRFVVFLAVGMGIILLVLGIGAGIIMLPFIMYALLDSLIKRMRKHELKRVKKEHERS